MNNKVHSTNNYVNRVDTLSKNTLHNVTSSPNNKVSVRLHEPNNLLVNDAPEFDTVPITVNDAKISDSVLPLSLSCTNMYAELAKMFDSLKGCLLYNQSESSNITAELSIANQSSLDVTQNMQNASLNTLQGSVESTNNNITNNLALYESQVNTTMAEQITSTVLGSLGQVAGDIVGLRGSTESCNAYEAVDGFNRFKDNFGDTGSPLDEIKKSTQNLNNTLEITPKTLCKALNLDDLCNGQGGVLTQAQIDYVTDLNTTLENQSPIKGAADVENWVKQINDLPADLNQQNIKFKINNPPPSANNSSVSESGHNIPEDGDNQSVASSNNPPMPQCRDIKVEDLVSSVEEVNKLSGNATAITNMLNSVKEANDCYKNLESAIGTEFSMAKEKAVNENLKDYLTKYKSCIKSYEDDMKGLSEVKDKDNSVIFKPGQLDNKIIDGANSMINKLQPEGQALYDKFKPYNKWYSKPFNRFRVPIEEGPLTQDRLRTLDAHSQIQQSRGRIVSEVASMASQSAQGVIQATNSKNEAVFSTTNTLYANNLGLYETIINTTLQNLQQFLNSQQNNQQARQDYTNQQGNVEQTLSQAISSYWQNILSCMSYH